MNRSHHQPKVMVEQFIAEYVANVQLRSLGIPTTDGRVQKRFFWMGCNGLIGRYREIIVLQSLKSFDLW